MANAMLDASLMPGKRRGVSPGRADHGAASTAPMDCRREGADRRREFRGGREHIRGRAATRSRARAADGVAAPGIEGGWGQDARVRAGTDRSSETADGSVCQSDRGDIG
jgi:hypothetical protein